MVTNLKTYHRLRLLVLFLLFTAGSMMNVTWAKVTYHILTLPFTTYNDNNSERGTYIVEALRCTSDELTVGLPDYFKSPLASNFTYYAESDVTVSATRSRIYQYITTTYDTYTINVGATPLNVDAPIADNSHIYVTYTYDNATSPVKLDGSVDYNIMLGNRFLCFNKGRNNRCGAILATNVTNENLVSEDFSFVEKPGFDSNKNQWFHFRFKYEGNDPYNITIRTSYNGDGTFKETDKALNKNVMKWYKGSSIFCQGKADGGNMLWLASDDDWQYTSSETVERTSKPGFYRGGVNNQSEMNPIFNSFAILQPDPSQGYIYIGSKINTNGNNWQPNSSGQYFYLTGNVSSGRDPKYQMKTPANVEKSIPYTIDKYTYKVTTSLGTVISVDEYMSHYELSENILSYIPEGIKRKYATFTGAYKDAALTNAITSFGQVDVVGDERVIWLKYTSSMPFETLPVDGCYDDARWYTIRMNGNQENQYVAFYDTGNSNCISSGRGSNSSLHQGENSPEAMFAFIGDPFELKIINRKASEDATEAAGVAETAAHNRFIGCSTNASAPAQFTAVASGSGFHDRWEIVYENTQMGTMILREMGTVETPRYIGWNYSAGNKPMIYSDTANRLKVVELEKKNYVYHIVRSDGTIAVKATEAQDVGKRLKYANIPEVIRSPLIDPSVYTGSTVTFYWTKGDADGGTNPRKNASYDADHPNTGDNVHVYVRYSSTNNLSASNYNVRLNAQYLYHDSGDIKSNGSIEAGTAYDWYLSLSDPYSMKIKNIAANLFIKLDGAWANNQPLVWDTEDNASLFIAKSSTIDGIYEVMAATGDGVDASTTNYNIGRPAANTVRMYSNSTYPHGYAQLRFLLTPTGATATDYYLIDKSNTELLVVRSMRQDLFFPADYRSPLVETYHYWTTAAHDVTLASLGSATVYEGVRQVYVTYDTSNRIDLQKGAMYLLQYETGDSFHQEDGADGQTAAAVPAVYPYCNGDCNFFVYGQNEYELQQQGAASTRTRWAWYLESDNNDPYHVKICSRQTETYNGEQRGYFHTYAETFGGSKHVVTNLAWPSITGVQGTEYMVLGSVDQYQLMTTNAIPVDQNNDGDYNDADESNERQVVKSFEQYWKTFDTIRKKIFGDPAKTISPEDPSTVPATPVYSVTTAAGLDNNRTYLMTDAPTGKGYHNYTHWAYAKRWNGYNISGAKSKGWEEIEHWYQTVNMGEGYFKFVPITIEPALILLDQHGWEIMRKPLPASPDDETKQAKYEAIRPYNSPMVKAYYFWGGAKKRSGFHQYYNLSSQIKVDGVNYTSTDLTKLPDYYTASGAVNATLFDKKGNQLDQYVTYVAKDEYAQSYDPTTGTGAKFLIQQGDNYASTSDGTSISGNAVANPGGMSQTIVDANGSFTDNSLWYVKPNTDIDTEMGYDGILNNWTNDYASSTAITGFNSNGFDPYNIQITSAAYPTKYFVTNATGAKIDDGIFVGNSSATTLSLGDKADDVVGAGHDSRTMPVTNATFMAVQDENGNMQLMPRFDNTRRVSGFSTLVVDQIGDAVNLPQTYTRLFRPSVFNYHIIDNGGNESLRYQSGGDLIPQTPAHFKSPLAKDFKYYNEAACTNEITASLVGAGKTDATNEVYVRYAYDEDADEGHILKGKWFTMQLNEMDAKYDSGIKHGDSKPATVDGAEKVWQWKFLETPQTVPDPYAVRLYNRSQAEGTAAIDKRFALLLHTSGDYALAEAGTEAYTYNFLNGTGMTTSMAATTATEADFKSTSGTFTGTGSQVKLIDDVMHTYNYKVYTNGTNGVNAVKYGVLAISADQTQAEASQNEFVPILPDAIMTPLLNSDQFLYYEKEADMGNTAEELQYLYGLYEDDVYVRYTAYNEMSSGYKVPNAKDKIGDNVARHSSSNDTSLGLSGNLIYNIIWRPDNMMKSNGTAIECTANQNLQAVEAYEWQFDGNDPYAIKIKNMSGKYVYNSSSNTCTLSDVNATTFMLLNKDGHDYGILQVTGDANARKLSGYGQTLTGNADADPKHFVIFALATHKVIYHLVLANIGEQTEEIPYREGDLPATPVAWNSSTDKKQFDGTTMRDLTTGSGATYQLGSTMTLRGNSLNYCYDAGQISLGAQLKVPDVFYRPNVDYYYYIEGVYSDEVCNTAVGDMNTKYKGYALTNMGDDTGLLGKTVLINVVYTFQGGLPTNAGDGFVTDASQRKWYTVESVTGDGTPWLAQYTNAWGLEVKEGRGSHYTNDYLWAPVGDPYGFQFYNRYIYKNSGALNDGEQYRVITSASLTNNQTLSLSNPNNYAPSDPSYTPDANSVYELLATSNQGYFMVHPVVNNTGTQYYFKLVDGGADGVHIKLGTVPSEFRFGLSRELFDPYFRYVGYVGTLKKSVYDANADLVTAMASGNELTAAQLMALQALVYDDDNLEPFTPGYYRLHSPAGIEGLETPRYASGYTHALERDPNGDADESDALPMHFYEQEGVETTFDVLPKQAGGAIGYTESAATRGELPIPAVEYDPASIFYITGTVDNATMSTQGLYVKGEIGKTEDDGSNAATIEATGVRAKAYMTETVGGATPLWMMDIGGGVFLIHDRSIPRYRKYLSYHQNDGAKIYDMKLTHNTHTDHAKWCLQPADMLGLYIKTNSGGDEGKYGTSYNYASFYAPFDILLPDDGVELEEGEDNLRIYEAFICDSENSPWNTASEQFDLHPKAIGRYHTGSNAGNNKFVPAGTPVLFAMWDPTGYVRVTLPNNAPSSPMTTGLTYTYGDASPVSCDNILSGEYLERKLSLTSSDRIYTFGLPLTGALTLDPATGDITATLPSQDNAGLGFYLNANPNKELHVSRGGWTRSNWYLYGNKVYYRASGVGGGGAKRRGEIQFVPVVFGDEEGGDADEPQDGVSQMDGDGCVYDLSGRRVASAQRVKDGTWRQLLSSGIYILNGKKIMITK